MNENSFSTLNDLKEHMDDLLDEMYSKIYKQAREEITKREADRIYHNLVAKKVYDKLNFEICKNIVKKSLPLRIILLNKIDIVGTSLEQNGIISIRYIFNHNNYHKPCHELKLDYFKIEDILKEMK